MARRGRSGSRLDRLKSIRTDLELAMGAGLPARDLAAVSREYRATLAEIDELSQDDQKGDAVDEIAQRRNARRPPASGSPRAKRPS